MAKAKNQQRASPSMQPIGHRPSAEEPMRTALREFALRVVGTQPGNSGELLVLMNEARELTDPVRVRAFLTRELIRVACFAIDHEIYGPLLKKTLETGLAACSRPGDDATKKGRERWSEVSSALAEQIPSGPDTPQQRSADRCMVVAAALAAALADPRPELAASWIEEGMGVLWVLTDDACAPGEDDRDLVVEALRSDIDGVSKGAPRLRSLAPHEDGPLGPLWPAEAPRWYRPVALPAPAETLTTPEEQRTLGRMAERQSTRTKAKEAVTDPLAAALDAFAELKPPRLPIASIDQVTPNNTAQVLEALARYMDEAGEAVVGVMRVLLKGLANESLPDLEATKDFASRVQELLDRARQAVECPKCGQPGRLEGVAHHTEPAGMLRVKHAETTHSPMPKVKELQLKKLA